MSYYDLDNALAALPGRRLTGLAVNTDYLELQLDNTDSLLLYAYGDCCSSSYFHDIIGVDKVLNTGPIVHMRELPNSGEDVPGSDPDDYDVTRAYGYEIVVEHEQYGDVTCVIAFRNTSNGYYGGNLEVATTPGSAPLHKVVGDVVDVSDYTGPPDTPKQQLLYEF